MRKRLLKPLYPAVLVPHPFNQSFALSPGRLRVAITISNLPSVVDITLDDPDVLAWRASIDSAMPVSRYGGG